MRRLTSPRNPYVLIVLISSLALAGNALALAASTGAPVLNVANREPIDLKFADPTSVLDIYSALGKAFGLQVLFDPRLKDSRTVVDLESVTAEEGLRILTHSSGHFFTLLDERTVMIADDTPQNRRIYERMVIRTFPLENIPLKDAMTMVRSLVGAKNIAASEQLNSLTMRDTAAKVEVAGRILETIDRHRGEIAVDVEVLYLAGKASMRSPGQYRLSPRELQDLRRSSRVLASQELGILDNDRGLWSLRDQVALVGSGAPHFLDVGFELKIQPRVHATSDEVTLEIALQVSDGADLRAGDAPVVNKREIESGVRLPSGESFLLTGLTTGSREGEKASWLASRFDLPEAPGKIVLTLTPRIIRQPGFTASDLAAICVGTEVSIGFCGEEETVRSASAENP